MGRDKAGIVVDHPDAPPAGGARPGGARPDGARPGAVTLAQRTAAALASVADMALEVGPAWSGLPVAPEDPPGAGPLAATAAGWRELRARGWDGPVLVVATDLPHLTTAFLSWLAGYPVEESVMPVAGGRVQPLCARYRPADLDTAAGLVTAGKRSMRDLVAAVGPRLVGEEEWAPVGGASALDDVDTPADLDRLGPGRG